MHRKLSQNRFMPQKQGKLSHREDLVRKTSKTKPTNQTGKCTFLRFLSEHPRLWRSCVRNYLKGKPVYAAVCVSGGTPCTQSPGCTARAPCSSPASSPATSICSGSARFCKQGHSTTCASWNPINTRESLLWCSCRQVELEACVSFITLLIFSTKFTVLSLRVRLLLPALALGHPQSTRGHVDLYGLYHKQFAPRAIGTSTSPQCY